MTKKTRTILFLIFLFLFLGIAPAAIFYSQGYRFDIDSKKITQTGGLFLKVEPKQAEIYVDGKLTKKTDFFFGSAFIENLLPKKYTIEVKKEGFYLWEKNLEIREKEVVEAKNIVLFPKNLNFNLLTKGVEDFWFSPDGKKIILKESSEKGWALKLYDAEKNIKSHLIEETDVYQKGADLMGLTFSEDSKEIYLDVGMKEQEKTFALKLDKLPPVLNEKIPTENIPIENIIIYKKINGDIYYLDNLGFLFKTDSSFGPRLKINEKPFPVKEETEYEIYVFSDFVFLRENDTLYLFSPESKSFEKFFEGINALKISPDNKKLVYLSDSEIWTLFLKEKYDQPTKKAGEKLFLLRLSEKIRDCFWLNPDYLIFNSGNRVKIAEIDDRDRINIIDLVDFNNPKIFWDQANKKLYLLSEGNLFVSEKLF